MPRVIGLTGGIASGKSLVSRILMGVGAVVIDADDIGREIMAKYAPVRQEVVKTFGKEVLKEGGQIDRGKLGRIIFRDLERRKVLERILHPLIQEEMWKRVQGSSGDVVLEVPLLIEKGEHEKVDLVVVVYVTREAQIQRLIRRDGISRQEAARRIDTQLPLKEKVSHAHYIINNTGSVEETEEQVLRFYQVIKGEETP
ncbi:MAG: dephospho-CoA kinase [Deltaproteobacteria bacterium]|nr:dephospho-CoA kinase [Deltaproteobacteria bacterium]